MGCFDDPLQKVCRWGGWGGVVCGWLTSTTNIQLAGAGPTKVIRAPITELKEKCSIVVYYHNYLLFYVTFLICLFSSVLFLNFKQNPEQFNKF